MSRAPWFGNARTLSRRIRRLHAEEESPRSYALLVVDLNVTSLRGAERDMALATVAEGLHRQFPHAGLVASLGDHRFGVVVHRHPGLAVGSEALRMWLESEPLVAAATHVWLMPLPETPAGIGPFVRELAGARRPLRVRAYEPRTAAGGGPGADLLRAAVPVSPLRRERRRLGLPGLLADGSGLLAAAVAVLVLAAALARVMGPVGIPSATSPSPFALSPAPPPAPEPSPETVSLPLPPAPEPPAVGGIVEAAALPRRPSAPPAPPAPPSPTPPPPAPAPAPAPEPAHEAQPEASPAPPPPAPAQVAVASQGEPWPPRDDGAGGHGPKHDEPPGKAEGHAKPDDD